MGTSIFDQENSSHCKHWLFSLPAENMCFLIKAVDNEKQRRILGLPVNLIHINSCAEQRGRENMRRFCTSLFSLLVWNIKHNTLTYVLTIFLLCLGILLATALAAHWSVHVPFILLNLTASEKLNHVLPFTGGEIDLGGMICEILVVLRSIIIVSQTCFLPNSPKS